MDGFKDSTKMKYMCGGPAKKAAGGVMKKSEGGGTFNERGKRATLAETEAEDRRMGSSMPAKKPVGKGSGVVPAMLAASKKVTDMTRKGVPTYSDKPMVNRNSGGKVMQPVQKKGLGGILKAMSPVAALASTGLGKDLMKSGVFGVGGLLASQLMKKKQSGQPLTASETQQLAQEQGGQTAMKKGGMAKKGVPVASKRPMVGLAAMPKKK